MPRKKSVREIPIWEKALLTVEECTAYTGIGIRKIRDLSNDPSNNIAIWIGAKKMINRKKLDDLIDKSYSI